MSWKRCHTTYLLVLFVLSAFLALGCGDSHPASFPGAGAAPPVDQLGDSALPDTGASDTEEKQALSAGPPPDRTSVFVMAELLRVEWPSWNPGDFNVDGIVDLNDWHILRTLYTPGVGAVTAAVPEPSTAVLAILAGLLCLAATRRRG